MKSHVLLVPLLLIPTLALAHGDQNHSPPKRGKPAKGLVAPVSPKVTASFDLVRTEVRREGGHILFRQEVREEAGKLTPTPTGQLAGSEVFSYVWPTSIDSGAVGFDAAQGILAFVLTAHPDFDDTPLEDENGDGNKGNDGNLWHSHWVVLVKDASCPGGLKVRDIPEGTRPKLPKTWPGLPILIDSPGFKPALRGQVVEVRIPEEAATFPAQFNYDGVTAALKVNANLHDPLLCVTGTFDVASGDLSLPGRVLR
ncbi:hypothetical protein D187_008480 [Cystobacter fuscus DSM 2262]|uniref:Lipoprotein n=1 Tax=Cystobacter fuscus (strain ATCC 25194 / DSM 2262 / NBRC 100088 / M29) TaxID=1242864 RepID=S9R055_CYSF2|nr:hypothetical protein [Cystobacter fuscus]EPX62293.1 hypothetical protein D187_008480 [Cystobacter fuscus DSM 2262]